MIVIKQITNLVQLVTNEGFQINYETRNVDLENMLKTGTIISQDKKSSICKKNVV